MRKGTSLAGEVEGTSMEFAAVSRPFRFHELFFFESSELGNSTGNLQILPI
jgi:hypothetical protein